MCCHPFKLDENRETFCACPPGTRENFQGECEHADCAISYGGCNDAQICVEKPGVGVVCEERPYICQTCDATGFSQEDLIISSGAFISESSQLDFAACTLSCSNEPKCAHATFLPKMHSCILREEGLMQSMATSARVRNR